MTEITLDIKFPRWRDYASAIKAYGPGLIAATLQRQRAMIFDTEGKYHGRPGWAPLKFRMGQILSKTGRLSQSIGPRSAGAYTPGHAIGTICQLGNDVVTIGTTIPYAATHDVGAIIRPVRAKALRWADESGEVYFRKKVQIPPRPFSDMTDGDIADLTDTVTNFISHISNGGSL